jgi:hypothetical protein
MFTSIFSIFEIPAIPSLGPSRNSQAGIDPAQAGTITVTGYWFYWFNTTLLLPITNARVEIYDEETTGIVYLGSTYTNYSGYFTFGPISNNDGPGEDGLDIIVTVNATSSAARVIAPTGITYSARTPTQRDLPDGTYEWYIRTAYGQRGAWWIFSYDFGLTRGWYYLSNTVGYNTPQVTACWPYGDWPKYWTNGTIHLPDWACWWSDIILHEYGHHVMNSLYGYIPATMENHTIQKISNSTTAWAEGWADFFPLAVFNNPVFTWANATHYININLEAPTWCWSQYGWDSGDEVEGRVAGALWDIYDSQNDSAPWYYDSFSNGFTNIWNIMHTTPCNTFHEFWQAWYTSGYPKQTALMAIFQNAIDYRGLGDVNGDCKCTIADFVLTIGGFGTQKGDPDWDKRRDLNNDDKVTMSDIVIAQANFGNSYDC